MTREEFRDKKSRDYRKHREACGIKDPVYLDEIEEAYYKGMVDADTYPHWMRVEDLPKENGWIITASLPLGEVDMFKYEGESAKALKDVYHITHWMPLPQEPKKGE